MNFITPWAFALSGLLLVITALYLLKLRRTEKDISSIYLWQQFTRDRQASAPWQKLKFNWLLLLQLLFLALLIFALARPFNLGQGYNSQNLIIILDSSASMAARDVSPTRLDAARQRAQQLIDEAAADTRFTVIEAGRDTQIRTASSQDRLLAKQAVSSIEQGSGSADLGLALELASAIASRDPNTQVILLSDGRAALPERLTMRGRLNYFPIGQSGENQAISALNVETSATGSQSVYAQIVNYGSQEAARRLSIFAGDQLLNVFDLKIPAGGQISAFADLPAEVGQIEAVLDGQDILPADDHAITLAHKPLIRRVALISNGNLFLKTALSLLPGIELVEFSPQDNTRQTPADLFIYDSVTPAEFPVSGSLLLIAPQSNALVKSEGSVKNPQLRITDPQDPLVRNLALEGINVLDAIQYTLPDWGIPVISGDTANASYPLLFRGETGGRRIAVLAFDLRRSDLTLNVAFPLLCANWIDWLLPGLRGDQVSNLAPGDTLSLLAETTTASLTFPDGHHQQLTAAAGKLTIADTNQTGLYRLQWDNNQVYTFTVNLFSPLESDLKPAGVLPGLDISNNNQAEAANQARREWWRWLALAALAILSIEWLVYQRTALAKLLQWVKRKPTGK